MSIENQRKRLPPVRLPFMGERQDIGEWTYEKSQVIIVTLSLYIVIISCMIYSKIDFASKDVAKKESELYIVLNETVELEMTRDKLKEEVKSKQDLSNVSNRVSNESSTSQRVDGGSTDDIMDELSASAAAVQQRLDANKAAYKEALESIDQMRNEYVKSQKSSRSRRDAKVQGNVTVSYSFTAPVRHAQNLVVPAYQCEGGGEVEVILELDRRGRVISARIVRGGDECMQQAALSAAKSSRFDENTSAPERQRGRITYIYIPQ